MTDRKEPPFFNDNHMEEFHETLLLYDPIELFIETLTGTCFELRVLPFEAVISVKAKIQRLEGIPVSQQHLIWNNLELEDEQRLHDYGIEEGCTLKLVLAMRGGPVNTRRVTMEDPMKEAVDSMEGCKEDAWEKNSANKPLTFIVVYREGDQINFFRVVDRGDSSLPPMSESLSAGSACNMCTEEGGGGGDGERGVASHSRENTITMNKMRALKAKMEDMNINKKPKKTSKAKPRPPSGPHPTPSITRLHRRLLHSLPQIKSQSRQPAGRPPPIADQERPLPTAQLPVPSPASFPSPPTRYTLQEDTRSPFAGIRPPPKISRLDVRRGRPLGGCVYPRLPPLCTRSSPETAFEPLKPVGEAVALSLLDESGGRVAPSQTAAVASFGEMAEPLSLNLAPQSEETGQAFDVGAPLGTWSLGSGGADLRRLGAALGLSPASSKPRLQPYDTQVKPCSPSATSAQAGRLRSAKVKSPGKRSKLLSKRDGRNVGKVAKQAGIEQASNLELLASLSARSEDATTEGAGVPLPAAAPIREGVSAARLPGLPQAMNKNLVSSRGIVPPYRRVATPTYHLPPVKAPSGTKKKSSKHCYLCGKKTGLASSYECRCGSNFCAAHRYAETHDCSYDYKGAGRRFLRDTNPLVSALKLPKI
ncbi:AN1-type zinc finger protein 4 [Stigmatopora argus]